MGRKVGFGEGGIEGERVGLLVGTRDQLGEQDGAMLGETVGVRDMLGEREGILLGDTVGNLVGVCVGEIEGGCEGVMVGALVGSWDKNSLKMQQLSLNDGSSCMHSQ